MAGDLLEQGVLRLLLNRPFYGHLLLAHRRRQGGTSPVGLTLSGGIPTITWNPTLLGTLSDNQQEALLEHVLKHLLHLHMARRRGRNVHDWDIACDIAVNQTVEGLPGDALHPDRLGFPMGLAAEEYYSLLADPFNCGNLSGAGEGRGDEAEAGITGEGTPSRGSTADDHACWEEADPLPLALAEEVVRGIVREAFHASDGAIPEDLRQVVEGMLAPGTIPWRQVLRQFVASAGRIGRSATWKREHRRFHHTTPGIRKRKRLNLLVAVDVSDSTDTHDMRESFARELASIARGREASITILYAHSRIRRIESFKGGSFFPEVFRGGGFTDLRPVFDHARRMHPPPAAVIYLTDGFGPAPEKMEFPTLWVLTREGEKPVPWGVELRLQD